MKSCRTCCCSLLFSSLLEQQLWSPVLCIEWLVKDIENCHVIIQISLRVNELGVVMFWMAVQVKIVFGFFSLSVSNKTLDFQ